MHALQTSSVENAVSNSVVCLSRFTSPNYVAALPPPRRSIGGGFMCMVSIDSSDMGFSVVRAWNSLKTHIKPALFQNNDCQADAVSVVKTYALPPTRFQPQKAPNDMRVPAGATCLQISVARTRT